MDWSLCWLAQAVATGDPDQAEHLAAKVSDAAARVEALNTIVAATANSDRPRAEIVADRAERIIRANHDSDMPGDWAQSRLAQAVALLDPHHAEDLAKNHRGRASASGRIRRDRPSGC